MKKYLNDCSSPRRVSPRCFAGLPPQYKKRERENESELYGPFPPDNGPARFIDYASDWVAHALTQVFISANAGLPMGQWVKPTIGFELNAIFSAMLGGRTHRGDIFEDAMHRAHRELFVAVVEVSLHTVDQVEVPAGVGFGASPVILGCYSMRVLESANACAGIPTPRLPVFRWDGAKTRFSLPLGSRVPGTNYVIGPYLAVAIYEPSSLAIAKIRLWPVWYSSVMQRMDIVRSNIERGGAAALATMGAIGCTLISRAQLCVLQEGLGHRWKGDLATYPYQPDYVIMPQPEYPPIVSEAFGIRNDKRYDASKAAKKTHGQQNSNVRFAAIEGKRLTENEVFAQMASLVSDPANKVWQPSSAIGAAA